MKTTAVAIAGVAVLMLAYAGAALSHTATTTHSLIFTSRATPKAPATARAVQKTPSRADAPVITTTGTAPGNAGFIHYFVITGPDGEPESQVGIEMPDNRIAWSFPDVGVAVSPFISSGAITANGKTYEVEHLYGIRPFVDDRSMRAFQRDLPARVASWVENKTPYCDEERPALGTCVSCLGFVLRVLFPGAAPDYPALPADFKSMQKNIYTTEDLLLYLAGVSPDAQRRLRLKRIESLAVPEELKEQLLRVAASIDAKPAAAAAAPAKDPKQGASKAGGASRSVVQLPKRVVPRRRS